MIKKRLSVPTTLSKYLLGSTSQPFLDFLTKKVKLENTFKNTENFLVSGIGMLLLPRPGTTFAFYGDLNEEEQLLVLWTCFDTM